MMEEQFIKVKYDFKYRYDPERQVTEKQRTFPSAQHQTGSPVGSPNNTLCVFSFYTVAFPLIFQALLLQKGLDMG